MVFHHHSNHLHPRMLKTNVKTRAEIKEVEGTLDEGKVGELVDLELVLDVLVVDKPLAERVQEEQLKHHHRLSHHATLSMKC
jgi:hypothetical protein